MEEQKLKMTRNETPPVRPTTVGSAVPAQGGVLPIQFSPEEMAGVLNNALDGKTTPTPAEPTPVPKMVAQPKFVPNDEVTADVKNVLSVPAGYIPVPLSSGGRLGIPTVLHVRDYIGSDALKMAQMNEDNQLEIMCTVLQGMIYEKIDVLDLHEEDMKELLLSVHASFWGPEIKGYYYPMVEEEFLLLPEEKRTRIETGLEFPTVDLHLGNITTIPLSDSVSEPINISLPSKDGTDTTASFILPRVGHEVYANRYVSKKYSYQEEKFSRIAAQLKLAEKQTLMTGDDSAYKTIDAEQREEYQKYLIERQSLVAALKQAQQIVSFNGVACNSIDEKLKAYERISIQFWSQLRKIISKNFTFGVSDLVEMVSPFTEEVVLRNCRFQPVDFVPSDRLDGSNEFIVTFGKQ